VDLELRGKVAIITGGSRGIGFHTARELALEGCRLGICARDPADLEHAAGVLRQSGTKVVAVQTDVTSPDDCVRFVERCAAELGGIDILINNAGGFHTKRLLETGDEDWRYTFEINVFQVIRMIRLVVPHMRCRGEGVIVNVGSSSGLHTKMQVTTDYSASKAAILAMTERLALDLLGDNIRVNCVSPGSTMWPGSGWDRIREKQPVTFAAYVADALPMGRLGKPKEVAQVIAFLASPRACWINGRNVQVDGLEQPTRARIG
jgi:3-oxoacyl-[acyl-carrier protein] reductase